MVNRYYKLSRYRDRGNSREGWEYIYFVVNSNRELKIISRNDGTHVSNSKLKELSEKETENILRETETIRDTSYG